MAARGLLRKTLFPLSLVSCLRRLFLLSKTCILQAISNSDEKYILLFFPRSFQSPIITPCSTVPSHPPWGSSTCQHFSWISKKVPQPGDDTRNIFNNSGQQRKSLGLVFKIELTVVAVSSLITVSAAVRRNECREIRTVDTSTFWRGWHKFRFVFTDDVTEEVYRLLGIPGA